MNTIIITAIVIMFFLSLDILFIYTTLCIALIYYKFNVSQISDFYLLSLTKILY